MAILQRLRPKMTGFRHSLWSCIKELAYMFHPNKPYSYFVAINVAVHQRNQTPFTPRLGPIMTTIHAICLTFTVRNLVIWVTSPLSPLNRIIFFDLAGLVRYDSVANFYFVLSLSCIWIYCVYYFKVSGKVEGMCRISRIIGNRNSELVFKKRAYAQKVRKSIRTTFRLFNMFTLPTRKFAGLFGD